MSQHRARIGETRTGAADRADGNGHVAGGEGIELEPLSGRIPVSLRLLAGATMLADRVAPPVAPALAIRLWFKTLRPAETTAERTLLERSERSSIAGPHGPLPVYVWGSGPTVLLVHGWSSHAGQMTAFVPPLLQHGFRVVAFDAPAHGRAPGRRTDIFEMRDALLRVADRCGPPEAVVTHSLGGLAYMAASARRPLARAAVLVSPGIELEVLVGAFAGRLGLSARSALALEGRLESWLGGTLEDARPRSVAVPALVIHDRDDPDVPLEEGRRIAGALPDGRFLATSGLGHRRIVRDRAVVREAARFVTTTLHERREPKVAPIRLMDS